MKAKGFDGLKILTPDNMTHDDIRSTVEHFVNAAVRAKKAGFDGVQLHGAHGYLLSQFFYPEFNHREDDYGGSAENRFRITMEIAAAIKYVCGDDFPVFLKLNSTDKPLSDVKPCSAHYFSDLVTALRLSAEVGIEAVELSGYHSSPAGIAEKPYFFDIAMKLAGSSPVPIFLVGGMRSASDAENALEFGIKAVSFCRPFICDRDFAFNLLRGKRSECIGCNKCFSDVKCHAKEQAVRS